MKSEPQPCYPFSRCPRVQEEFKQYLTATPNKKHISLEEKYKLVAWLADPNAKPTCQKDYSRRNYAQKTYRWDESHQQLWAVAKNDKGRDRVVITEDEILPVVERVHTANHGGWDATWDRVSRLYCGIVRSDIIFLVKRCGFCQSDPRKRAKGEQAQTQTPAYASASASAPAPVPSPPMTPPEPRIEYGDCDQYDPYEQYLYLNNDGENEGNDQLQIWQEGGWQQDYMDLDIDPSLLIYYPPGEASGSGSNTYNYDFGQ